MTDTITIDGTVVDRSEAEKSAKKSAGTIQAKLSLAAKHTMAAAIELLSVYKSETYFALVTAEELEESGASSAWVAFYKLCKLSSSKASRMLTHAKAVEKLQEHGMTAKQAQAVSQDTAAAAGKYAKLVGWKKVSKFMLKHEPCTTSQLREKFEKKSADPGKPTDPGKPGTPTVDSKPIDTVNDALQAVEAQFQSDKPIDHESVDFELVEQVIADLQALLANRPS